MRLRDEGIVWEEIDGELVILDLDRSVYLTVNGSGAVLAKRLVDEASVEDLVDTLTETYGVARSSAESDVAEFVEALRDKRLLA